jgi:hypothetical protein
MAGVVGPYRASQPHTFVVSAGEARFLLVTRAAGSEGFIRTLGTPAFVAEIRPAPRRGITLQW